MGRQTTSTAGLWLGFVFVCAFILVLTGFVIIAAQGHVEAATLQLEVAKMCLQVAGVILFGGLIGLSTAQFQKDWERRRENLKRQADNLRDIRQRQDVALRSILNETLGTYNKVKRLRRIFQSKSGNGMISKKVYQRLLLELIDHQLQFEAFARTVKSLDDERLFTRLIMWDPGTDGERTCEGPRYDVSGLRSDYDGIESYLNTNIKEFTRKLQSLPSTGEFALNELRELHLFVTNAANFRAGISRRFDRIEAALQKALLVPLELPKADNGAS